jgi:putative pyruvate formate lyase activating enzyme
VFFTYCNSRCIYCQNYDISQLAHGEMISEKRLARIYLKLQKIGCHNINFVTPAHFLPHIMKALVLAADEGLEVPLVYNSNGYDSLEVLGVLDGVIDIYLPDLKFSDEHKALRLTRMPSYPQKARAAIAEMYRQVGPLKCDDNGIAYRGVIVRHLVLPNNYAGTGKVLEWLADIDEDIQISLMGQYFPAYHANTVHQISRRITWDEYKSAAATAAKLGLKNVSTQNIFLSCGA